MCSRYWDHSSRVTCFISYFPQGLFHRAFCMRSLAFCRLLLMYDITVVKKKIIQPYPVCRVFQCVDGVQSQTLVFTVCICNGWNLTSQMLFCYGPPSCTCTKPRIPIIKSQSSDINRGCYPVWSLYKLLSNSYATSSDWLGPYNSTTSKLIW